MTSIFAFVFVLGVLIFVHELGHFLMARRIGVRVLTFSLGFGPKLLSFRRGDTEYCISAIPLGGYVKMAGENPEDTRTGRRGRVPLEDQMAALPGAGHGSRDEHPARHHRDGGRPLPGRAAARVRAAAGRHRLVRRQFRRANAPACRPGDRIVSVDGKPVETWEQFSMAIVSKAKREVSIGYVRNGQHGERDAGSRRAGQIRDGRHRRAAGRASRGRRARATGQPAEEAGLQPGDVVLAAGGEQNVGYEHLLAAIKSHSPASRCR